MTRDDTMMSRALHCAARAWGRTSPNPLVGAVLARGDTVVAEAWHERAGWPHAEPQVLDKLSSMAGRDLQSSGSGSDLTLYVNLEPCNHIGRTPPCTEAILASPVRRVVVAVSDPDPRVSGRGIARLRDAGLEVTVGVLADQARELNHVYLGRQLRGRPFVLLKVALSGDGCIAGPDRQQVRITGAVAQRQTHTIRAGVDAILVGIETLRIDRPQLDTRHAPEFAHTPRRVILDPRLRLQPQWLRDGSEKPLLVCCAEALFALSGERRAELERLVEFQVLPGTRDDLHLEALPGLLASRGLWSVLVEGGGNTHRRFLQADLWDRMVLHENSGLRLAGTPWEAAGVWQEKAKEALLLRTETLEETTARVYTQPLAWERPGDTGRAATR